MKIEINGKLVGEVIQDIYFTKRDSRMHFYRKMQGYPISVEILNKLKELGIKQIHIEETRTNKEKHTYQCYVSDYDSIISFKEIGHDEQKCIPLRRMKEVWIKERC